MSLRAFMRTVEGLPIDFASAHLRAAAERRYAGTPQRARQVHCQLAAYFIEQADPRHDGSFEGSSPRGISEVAYHLARGQMNTQLVHVLTSLAFVERKCALGMTHDLISDLLTASSMPTAESTAQASSSVGRRSLATSSGSVQSSGFSGIEKIRQFAAFVSANAHILAGRPHLTF
jgi:telomerase protein component 1